MAKCGIYLIENTVSPLFYIGQSSDIASRWRQHRYALSGKRHVNHRLKNSWDKHGDSAFVFKILEECAVEDLTEREVHWLSVYRAAHPDEVANWAGPVDQPMRGQKHTEQACRNMAKSRIGRVCSEETRNKIRDAQKGRKHTAEHVRNMSLARKGVPNPHMQGSKNPVYTEKGQAWLYSPDNNLRTPEHRALIVNTNSKAVIDLGSGETWKAVSSCAKELKVTISSVCKAIRVGGTCRKRKLAYVEDIFDIKGSYETRN